MKINDLYAKCSAFEALTFFPQNLRMCLGHADLAEVTFHFKPLALLKKLYDVPDDDGEIELRVNIK